MFWASPILVLGYYDTLYTVVRTLYMRGVRRFDGR